MRELNLISLALLAVISSRPVLAPPLRAADKETAITAETLTKAFAANESAARKKYNGKTIVVEGKVVERSKEKVIDNYVLLEGHAKKGKGTYKVYCRFAFTDEADILKLKPGDKVKIQGESHGTWGVEATLRASCV